MACFHKLSRKLVALGSIGLIVLTSSDAYAWSKHHRLMPAILESLPAGAKAELAERRPAPCLVDDQKMYQTLSAELELSPSFAITPTSPTGCAANYKLSGFELLGATVLDEPDSSFDLNLPDSYDPAGDRKWMGGNVGPTSQGFRHMFFGGWKFLSPIATFQYPFGAMGQSPTRAQVIGERARKEIQSGSKLWGYRLLGWSMHYIQDLSQPFHAVQIPSLRMLPWTSLFSGFVGETTRIISNYHWAYEDWVVYESSKGDKSRFHECLLKPTLTATIPPTRAAYAATDFPRDLALTVANASRGLASSMGSALIAYFGTDLKKPGYDLAHSSETLDYEAFDKNPALREGRDDLIAVTCSALSNGSLASSLLIEWALNPAKP